MESNVQMRRIAAVRKDRCIACGCCEKVCPKGAIRVPYGITALVAPLLCVGCALCEKACPASVITMEAS